MSISRILKKDACSFSALHTLIFFESRISFHFMCIIEFMSKSSTIIMRKEDKDGCAKDNSIYRMYLSTKDNSTKEVHDSTNTQLIYLLVWQNQSICDKMNGDMNYDLTSLGKNRVPFSVKSKRNTRKVCNNCCNVAAICNIGLTQKLKEHFSLSLTLVYYASSYAYCTIYENILILSL